MFGFFSKKREIEEIKEEVKNSFEHVKDDIDKTGQWITHLNNSDVSLNSRLNMVEEEVSSLKDEIEQFKEVISMFGEGMSKQPFKTNKGVFNKQIGVDDVQTSVETPVQTGNFYGLSNLSVTEKAIIWVLVNNNMKLSYEDLAAMLGKTKSTIRGQINSIKQKSEGLVKEYMEQNGKKRVYIPEEIKEKILKKSKVRVKTGKNKEKKWE